MHNRRVNDKSFTQPFAPVSNHLLLLPAFMTAVIKFLTNEQSITLRSMACSEQSR